MLNLVTASFWQAIDCLQTYNGAVTAFATFWIAIFTVVLALVGRRQAILTRESVSLAKSALVSVERAFLYISVFETNFIGSELRILPQWKNAGTTAANPVTNHANWKTFPNEPPANYPWPDLDGTGKVVDTSKDRLPHYLGPQATTYGEILKIPLPILEDARTGKFHLFIWGWAEYRDVFADTPTHRSEFCNEIMVTDLGIDGGKITVALAFAKYGPFNRAT